MVDPSRALRRPARAGAFFSGVVSPA